MKDYQALIDALNSDEPNKLAILNAQEASRHWLVMISEILSALHDPHVLHELGLDRPLEEAGDAQEAASLADLFFELILRSASQRSWTQSTLSEVPPHCWCAVVSSDVQEGNAALRQMRADCVHVGKALDAIKQVPPRPEKEAGQVSVLHGVPGFSC